MRTENYPNFSTPLLSILAIIAMAVSYFYMDTVPADNYLSGLMTRTGISSTFLSSNTMSIVIGVLFIVMNALTITIISNLFTSAGLIPMSLYLILVLSNPLSIYLTPLHITSFLMMGGILFMIDSKRGEKNDIEKHLVSYALIAASSLFYPPIVWIIPILIVTNLAFIESKVKYILIVIIGAIIPFLLYIALYYLINGWAGFGIRLQNWSNALFTIEHKSFAYSSATACKLLIVIIASIISIFGSLKKVIGFSKAKTSSVITLSVISASLFLLVIIFYTDCSYPYGLIIYPPLSLLIADYSSSWNKKGRFATYFTLFIMLLIVERLTFIL